VTSTGQPAAGYTLNSEGQSTVDCAGAEPSSVAVSPNIDWCSPSAAYAVACWKAADGVAALCLRDPSVRQLVRLPLSGSFAVTGLPAVRDTAPQLLVLSDGDRCMIRDGGAWSELPGHPSWAGTYACVRDGAVWAPPGATHNGVNESSPAWTVLTAPMSGQDARLTQHTVATAYFVGTAA
jgi:hypothetical protein